MPHAPDRPDLAKLPGRDRHGVKELLDLDQPRGSGDQRADPVPGQAVGLGKRIQLDQRVAPVRIGEKVVGRALARIEVAVGFVHHQRDPPRPAQIEEGADDLGRVFRARGVVGGDQHDRAGARGDEGGGPVGVGDHPLPAVQRHRGHPLHVEPHLVIEVPRDRHDHLVPRTRQRRHRRAEGLVAALRDRDVSGPHRAAIGLRPLRGNLGPQIGVPQHGPVKMRVRPCQRGVGDRRAQPFGRRIDGGGLAHVDERAVVREGDVFQPAPRLHHRGAEGGGQGGVQRHHVSHAPSRAGR